MPIVAGTSYRDNGTTCSSRVIRAGPSYRASPFCGGLFRSSFWAPPYYPEVPPRIYLPIEPSPAMIAIAAIVIASLVAIDISRDCRYIGTDCTYTLFSGRVCTPYYDCKW